MTAEKKKSWWRRLWIPVTLLLLLLAGGGIAMYTLRQPGYRVNYQRGQLQLRSGQTSKALDSFRRALDQKPDYRKARLGMVRALTSANSYEEATNTLKKASNEGLKPWRAARLQAKIYMNRARHRIQTKGDALDPETCMVAIKKDVEPAIDLLKEHVDETPEPARMLTQLGDAYMRKSSLLGRKRRLLQEELRLAQNADNQERAEKLSKQLAEVLPKMGEAQGEAMNSYREAIRKDKDAVEARLAAARHLLSMYVPRPGEARQLLQPIVKDTPSHRDARMLLAQSARAAGNYEEALDHLDKIQPSGDEGQHDAPESDPAIERLRAQILADDGQWEQARKLAQTVLQGDQNDMPARFVLGRALLNLGEYDQATTHLQYIFARTDNPWPQARLALAKALKEAGSTQQAVTAFQQAIAGVDERKASSSRILAELRKVRYEANLALAKMLSEQMPDMVLEHARNAFKIRPDQKEAYRTLHTAMETNEVAEEERVAATLAHASALARAEKPEEALAVCESEIENATKSSNKWRLRLQKCRILARQGSYTKAIEQYRALWQDSENPGPAHELAALHLELEHYEKARTIYQKLRKSNQQDRRALLGLVRIALAQGKTDRALSIVQTSREKGDSQATTALLMKLYARHGQLENATELVDALVESNPENASLRVASARLHWATGNREKARVAFQKAIELDPDHLPAYSRGLLDLEQERYQEAIELFQNARKRFPRHPAPVLHLAVAYQAKGQPKKATQTLEKGLKEDSPLPAQARSGLHWTLALMHAGQGQKDKALRHNGGINSRAFGLRDERATLLKKLASAENNTRTQATTALCLANALRRGENQRAALRKARRAKQLLPDSPIITCWKLGIRRELGERNEAISGYQQLIQEHPDLLTPRVRLAETYAAGDKIQQAVDTLREALAFASESQSGVLHLHIARLYERMERYDDAVKSYRAVVRTGTESAEAYNNMAYILATRKDKASAALPLAEKALELAGPRPRILDTLGWVHCLNGNYEAAATHLERARAEVPQLPEIRYHLGVAYHRAGKDEKAAEELREALSISTSFQGADDARNLLQELQ